MHYFGMCQSQHWHTGIIMSLLKSVKKMLKKNIFKKNRKLIVIFIKMKLNILCE